MQLEMQENLSYLGLIAFKECYDLVLNDKSVFIQSLGIVWPAAALAVSSCSGWTVEEGWEACQSLQLLAGCDRRA